MFSPMTRAKKIAISGMIAIAGIAGLQSIPAAHADELTPAQTQAISTIDSLSHLRDFERTNYEKQIQNTQDPAVIQTIINQARNADWADTL